MSCLAGPGYPYDAPLFGEIEYMIYNIIRGIVSSLTNPLSRFMPSGYNLAIRRDVFLKVGVFH